MTAILNLIKTFNSNLLGPINAIFGEVGVFVFRVVHMCWYEC
jgi:hypothetical protein